MSDAPLLVECPHCGSAVPAGEFCGHCGAQLMGGGARRAHAFAAVPSEPVAHLSIVTTLFPHLPHRHGAPFRAALVGGVLLVAVLAALHVFALATVAAVLLLPVLYLMYLYEVEIYENEPWVVIGATIVTGAILGVAFARISGDALAVLVLTGDQDNALVVAGIAIPIVAQALMLAGPLFLYLFRDRFREPLDGLTFGAASALGFSLASSLTIYWPALAGPLVASGSPVDWALRLAGTGLLLPLVNATTTALVCAAIWLQRYDRRRTGRPIESSILVTLVVAFGSQVAIGILRFEANDLLLELTVLLVASAALLVYLRRVIHDALLIEGASHEIGPDAPCPECHRVVPTMAFCPACGAARSASSKHARRAAAGGA